MAITAPLVLALVLSILIGVSLGLLGGGGSILTVPILTYVLGMDPSHAITSSLFVVGVTALVGMLRHARAGRISWRTGVVFGLAGMAGAFVGGLVGGYIPGAVLMVVPALALLGGLPMALAIGTSLLVISMQSSAGLAGHLLTVSLDLPVVLAVTAMGNLVWEV